MKEKDSDVRKRKRLTPEEKYQIFLEATMARAQGNGGISEVLRRWAIHSSDLTRIKRTVEEGAISSFKERKSRSPKIDNATHQKLKVEKERLETVILELSSELALIKKKDRSI